MRSWKPVRMRSATKGHESAAVPTVHNRLRHARPDRLGLDGPLRQSFVHGYVLLGCVLLPVAVQPYADMIFVSGSAILLAHSVIDHFASAGTKVSSAAGGMKAPHGYYLVLSVIVLLAVATSEYSSVYTASTYAFVLAAGYQLDRSSASLGWQESGSHRMLSLIMTAIIGWQTVAARLSGQRFVLWSSWDENFSGIVTLLFLMWCVKNRFHLGVLVALSTLFVNESRLFLMLTLLFFALRVIKIVVPTNWRARSGTVALAILTMTVVTVPLSAYWVEVVAANGVATYRDSFNDTSNRMRFAANLMAIEQLAADPSLFLTGYDKDIKPVLGVIDVDDERSPLRQGDRAIVPHHAVFNLVLRSGAVFTLVYFLLVGRIVDRYFTRENWEYVVTYLLGSLFMHSLLIGPLLVFWLMILATPSARSTASRSKACPWWSHLPGAMKSTKGSVSA